MNGRPLTDAELAAGLRAHLPGRAAAGLRERIMAQVDVTTQVRRLPWAFGLGDADPTVRRRALLLVALLGLVAATSVVAVPGAWLRSQDRSEDVARSNEVDTFVLASYERLTKLPAFRLVMKESLDGTSETEYFYDGVGALREEYGSSSKLFTRDYSAQRDGDTGIWVLEDDNGHPLAALVDGLAGGPTDCAAGWESLETIELIGRPTRHVRCMTADARLGPLEFHLWIDIAIGLPLRAGSPMAGPDETGAMVSMGTLYRDVVELEFAPQPADLFILDGETMSGPEYLCATEGRCASPRPAESGPAMPVVSPPPAPEPGDAPADLDAFVAEVHAAYERAAPVEIRLDIGRELPGSNTTEWRRDGLGNYQAVREYDPSDEYPPVVWLTVGGHSYEMDPRPDGRVWRDWGPSSRYGTTSPTMGLPNGCGVGWRYLGDDLVLDRPAAHIACGFQEFWIDRTWMFVTRAQDHDPLLGDDPRVGLGQVLSVTFEQQPAELFAPPSPESIWRSP